MEGLKNRVEWLISILVIMIILISNAVEARLPVLHRVGGGRMTWVPNINFTDWSNKEHFYVGDWLCKYFLSLSLYQNHTCIFSFSYFPNLVIIHSFQILGLTNTYTMSSRWTRPATRIASTRITHSMLLEEGVMCSTWQKKRPITFWAAEASATKGWKLQFLLRKHHRKYVKASTIPARVSHHIHIPAPTPSSFSLCLPFQQSFLTRN